MKVVLTENVKGVGKKLDIVNVSEGYARNYLIPRNLAKPADIVAAMLISVKCKFKQDTDRELARKQKEEIEKITIEFKLKAAENGKLFGSVTSKEIADELNKIAKIQIDKKKITLEDVIKQTGIYTASIKLYEGIIAKLKVKIVNL